MDANTVSFTITNFDENRKLLSVTFENGSTASIQLMPPFPQTQEEIENVVKQFTPPTEVVHALNANTDLSFVSDLINQTITTTRFSISRAKANAVPTINNTVQANTLYSNVNTPPTSGLSDTDRAKIYKNMELKQKSDLANTLISFGLLQTNPVDLSQIVPVVIPTANT